jgi:hypothetical protein
MKAIILNGALKDREDLGLINRVLEQNLSENGYGVESLQLRDIDIQSCIGCFGCWKKTPGICVIDDPAREINEKIIQCDLVVYLAPVTFGGWSSELKKMYDRQLPLLPPAIVLIDGECHHGKRYDRYPSILGIGVAPDRSSEEVFGELVSRNSINFYAPKTNSGIILSNSDEAAISREIVALLEAVV